MLLVELLELYVSKRLKGKSPNTIRLYHHSINSFAKTVGVAPRLEHLTDENIERHMWRVIRNGRSIATANKDHGQLTALWRFASHNRLCETWPNSRAMDEPERVPMGWLPEECDALLKATRMEPGMVGTVKASLWWECLVQVLLETGERIGAIRQLPKSAVQDQWLLVDAQFRKGKRRDKLYTMQPETIKLLRTLIATNRDSKLLFPWDRCETYVYNRYKSILRRAGLPDDRRSSFHRVRRTVASAVARGGGDATAALDHASPRTTKRYLDPRIVGGVKPSDIIAAYLRNPPTDLKRKQA
jgi:integrase